MGLGPDATHAQTERSDEKLRSKLAKNPSGFFLYHPAGSRPMNMGKYLTVEFITELVEAFLVVWLLAQTRIVTFARPGRVRDGGGNLGRHRDQRFLLELVGFPDGLHGLLHVYPGRRIFLGRARGRDYVPSGNGVARPRGSAVQPN